MSLGCGLCVVVGFSVFVVKLGFVGRLVINGFEL